MTHHHLTMGSYEEFYDYFVNHLINSQTSEQSRGDLQLTSNTTPSDVVKVQTFTGVPNDRWGDLSLSESLQLATLVRRDQLQPTWNDPSLSLPIEALFSAFRTVFGKPYQVTTVRKVPALGESIVGFNGKQGVMLTLNSMA